MDSEDSYEFSSSDDDPQNFDGEPTTAEFEKQKEPPIQPKEQEVKKPSIKDYEVLGLLGEGAFGKVHHVVRKIDGEQFAIKVLSKKNVTKKVQNEIQRERMLLMNVDHPNIIKLSQCFHDAKNLYFVMDWAQNGELFNYMLNEGVLDYKIAQFISAELVDTIAYLQEKYIWHRDIKPGNILFDGNMHIKIIDFGSGKSYKDNEVEKIVDTQSGDEMDKDYKRMNTFTGTWEYMAPEIIKGAYISNACDLWAVGIIIYKFFAEFSPFSGDQHEILEKIWEEEIQFPDSFPDDAKDLWSKLLKKDPMKRLGAGAKGTENDMFALKSHRFFEGIDFESLTSMKSPIAKPMKRQSSMKEKVIAKYKKEDSKALDAQKPEIYKTNSTPQEGRTTKWEVILDSPEAPKDKLKIEDWKYEKDIKIIHRELIAARSKMYIIYNPIIALITDEPAFYTYSLKSGMIKFRYDMKECIINRQSKTKFKLVKKDDSRFKVTNKFKIKAPKKSDLDYANAKNLIEVLTEIKNINL